MTNVVMYPELNIVVKAAVCDEGGTFGPYEIVKPVIMNGEVFFPIIPKSRLQFEVVCGDKDLVWGLRGSCIFWDLKCDGEVVYTGNIATEVNMFRHKGVLRYITTVPVSANDPLLDGMEALDVSTYDEATEDEKFARLADRRLTASGTFEACFFFGTETPRKRKLADILDVEYPEYTPVKPKSGKHASELTGSVEQTVFINGDVKRNLVKEESSEECPLFSLDKDCFKVFRARYCTPESLQEKRARDAEAKAALPPPPLEGSGTNDDPFCLD